jgi:alpha-galactosidase
MASLLAVVLFGTASLPAADAKNQMPKHDGKPADMTKPVQVFILLGQSNMLGLGNIAGKAGSLEEAVKTKGKYSYLVDDSGAWIQRKDVRKRATQ